MIEPTTLIELLQTRRSGDRAITYLEGENERRVVTIDALYQIGRAHV